MNMRERSRWPGGALVLGLLLASLSMPVAAEDDLDVTITVIEDNGGDIEREVTRRIELPPRADAPGRDVSREARERGREFGRSRAEEARSRRGPPDNAGAGPPDNPGGGPPDNPGGGPPENPGGG